MEIQDPLLPLVKNLKDPGILDFGAENRGKSDSQELGHDWSRNP